MNENLALYIVVALFIGGVTFTLKMIFDRINKNESDLETLKRELDLKICASYDTIRAEYKDLTQTMEKNKQEIVALVTAESGKTVTLTHCDLKQEIWGERFNNMMDKLESYTEQNEKEHGMIIDTMTKNASARTQQMADISERLSVVADCVKSIQEDRECKK